MGNLECTQGVPKSRRASSTCVGSRGPELGRGPGAETSDWSLGDEASESSRNITYKERRKFAPVTLLSRFYIL